MIKKAERQYRVKVNKDRLINILSDLTLYGQYHPLICSVSRKVNTNSDFPLYLMHEKPVSWLPFKISYDAEVQANAEEIRYIIYNLPFNRPTMYYKLTDHGDIVIVDFVLEIEGNGIGADILMKKMLQAQETIMASVGLSDKY